VTVTPKYASVADWCAMSGMGRSAVYEALGRGDLRAVKLGSKTLIDCEAGLEWFRSLPTAEITTGRQRRSAPSSAPGPRHGSSEAAA
jgi:hypothetical protein